jgi:uncharacterized tellurite resistance protein B-like protein
MFDRILELLSGGAPIEGGRDELPAAVAALLVEAALMDQHFDPAERAVIERLLGTRFRLSGEATRQLVAAAEETAKRSTQLFPFTRIAAERLGPEERVELIEMLWEVAYADGVLDADEDALLRRVAGLIYVSDHDRGEARKRVLRRLGLAGRR